MESADNASYLHKVMQLSDILDIPVIQSLMERFHALTGMGISIVDMEGNILVATGWQDICVKFHRPHPQAGKFCRENEIEFCSDIAPGEIFLYKCKNGIRDSLTPIFVDGQHLGNLSFGQFFFDDEEIDYDFFRNQARKYGFDEDAYLEALARVPRFDRKKVDALMDFYVELAQLISKMGFRNAALLNNLTEKTRLLNHLKASEEELSAIYQNAPFMIMLLDAQRRVRKVNGFTTEVAGRAAKEMIGRYGGDALRCIHALDSPKGCGFGPVCHECAVRNTVMDTIETGREHQQVEAQLTLALDKGNKEITCLVSTAKMKVRKEPRVLVGILDITERKTAEKALARSEAKYRLIAENADDVICLQDMDLNFTYVSPSAERLRGYSPEEVMGQTLDQILTPESLDLVTRVYAEEVGQEAFKNRQGSTTRTLELEEYRKDDSTVWVELTASLLQDESGKPTGILTVTRNISARKKAQQALEQSEAKHRLLADNTLDVIWTMDMETRFAYVNPAIRQMFGFEPKEWVGTLLADHCDKQEMAMMSSIIAHELEHGDYDKGVCFETIMLRKDKSPIDVEILASFILDENRCPVGIQGTTRDITERKAAHKEKEKLQAQLAHAHKMQAVSNLAGGIAHDFNNMLGAIIGHAELALVKLDSRDPARKDILAIHEAGNRSAKLVSQLLAFASRQPVSPRVINLNDAVDEKLSILKKLASERVKLTFKPGGLPCTVNMDPMQIDSILTNLVLNARDAVGASGTIIIETGRASFDQEYCSKNPDFSPGDFVLLTVADNGCGMDEGTLEKLFDPFFTTKEVGKGTGLGLPTVWGAVQQNGGFITVKSNPGKGAVFNIHLPFCDKKLPAQGPDPKAAQKHKGNETILLVEDEPMLLKPTKALLELWGYKVLAAENPADAIEIADTWPDKIDLLFSDVIMPNMNGLELMNHLKALRPEMKCLFMSGYTADVISKQGIMQSDFVFLEKPFRHAELSAKLLEALGKPVQGQPE